MLSSTPRFVTPDDFRNYWGIDLSSSLRGFDNNSNKANIFLSYVEDVLLDYIDYRSVRNYKWEDLEGERLEALQKAILIQAEYMFRNGDITTDSGYDPTKGKVVDSAYLDSISICQHAIVILSNAGLFNHVLRNTRRFTRFH